MISSIAWEISVRFLAIILQAIRRFSNSLDKSWLPPESSIFKADAIGL